MRIDVWACDGWWPLGLCAAGGLVVFVGVAGQSGGAVSTDMGASVSTTECAFIGNKAVGGRWGEGRRGREGRERDCAGMYDGPCTRRSAAYRAAPWTSERGGALMLCACACIPGSAVATLTWLHLFANDCADRKCPQPLPVVTMSRFNGLLHVPL